MAGIFRSLITVRRNLDKTGYGAVRLIQYLSTSLDPNTTSDQITPPVSFTDFNKVMLVPVHQVPSGGGSTGAYLNIRWQVLSNSNVTVFHHAPGGTPALTFSVAVMAVEFY